MAAAIACAGPAAAHERPATAPAAQFLQGTVARAFELARPPVSTEAGAELAALIERSLDWPGLTRFAIGRYGAELDVGDMGSITGTLVRRLDILVRRAGIEFPTMTLAVRDMRIGPDGMRHVISTATVPRFGEIEVEWAVAAAGGGYRIADVKALGLTLRQFLRGWVVSLVAARGGDAAAAFGEEAATSPR